MRTHLIGRLARGYRRWRHGRGFGIHSPFAYDFITRTLRERLPYYAYSRLDALAESRHMDAVGRRSLRLIFRIAVRFNPAGAAIVGRSDDVVQKLALKSVRRDMNLEAPLSEAGLIIFNGDAPSLPVPRDGTVCVFPDVTRGGSSSCEALWASATHGMRFDNRRGFTVIVLSSKLPRQQFDVRF